MSEFTEKRFDYSEADTINLIYCGIRESCYGHKYGRHTLDNFILTFINEGNATFNINGKEVFLSKNHFYVMHSKSEMSYVTENNTPWSISWLVIEGKAIENILDMIGITRDLPFLYISDPYRIKSIYDEMFEKVNRADMTSKMECISLLYSLFAALSEEKSNIRRNTHIEKALKYIHENYCKSISVQEIAEHLCLSNNYFSKLFNKSTGKSPMIYINELKLKKAKYLLKHTDMTVQEICRTVGYTDQFYFSRIFKKLEKMSPLNYRYNADKNS